MTLNIIFSCIHNICFFFSFVLKSKEFHDANIILTGGPQTGNISTSMTSSDTVSAVFSDRILAFHMDERVRCPPKSTSVSQRGWDRQLRDRRWHICLAANMDLSAYWRALSKQWFMLEIPIHHRFHHLWHSSFWHLPKIHRAALCKPSKALLSLTPCSPVYEENSGFIFGMTLRASTFLFPLSLLSQKEAYTVYSKMILFTSVHKALVLM